MSELKLFILINWIIKENQRFQNNENIVTLYLNFFMIKLPNIKRKQPSQIDDHLDREDQNTATLSKQIEKLNETLSLFCSNFAQQLKQYSNNRNINIKEGNEEKSAVNHYLSHEIKGSKNVQTNNEENQIQERFRIVNVPVEKIGEDADREYQIKKFLVKLVNTVSSKGFYYFEKHLLNQQKYRFFCCRNIIYKISQFSKLNSLTQPQLQFVDRHLQEKLLPFVKNNYPTSQKKGANLKLAKKVIEINNMDSNMNDLIHPSGVKFRKRVSGDYTPQICALINYMIDLTKERNQDENQKQETLFSKFYRDMDDFFEKVQSQEWMVEAQKGNFINIQQIKKQKQQSLSSQQVLKSQRQHQKYRQKVLQYTKSLIGKKLPPTLKKYTNQQISESVLQLDNPSLMRILSKWIEELQSWFGDSNKSIMTSQEMVRMRDGTERFLSHDFRYHVYNNLGYQAEGLQLFRETITKNNSQMYHTSFHSNKSQQFKQFVPQQQSQWGYFSTLTSKCYSSYLLGYLNKLIDSILTAQNKMTQFNKSQSQSLIPSLISFRIGDLMRCKCSSKQNQILALFSYLQHLSSTQKDVYEIVRVKNRLNQGTKDILINLRYRQTIVVEMQLSIDGDKSNFVQCSEKANHFLYELERASFGAISEMCNILLNSSPQSSILKKAFDQLNTIKIDESINITCSHTLQTQSLPFWCSKCSCFNTTIKYGIAHKKCPECKITLCSRCFLQSPRQQKIEKPKNKQQALRKLLGRNSISKEVLVLEASKRVLASKKYVVGKVGEGYFIFLLEDEILRKIKLKKQCLYVSEIIDFFKDMFILEIHYPDSFDFEDQIRSQLMKEKIKNTKKKNKKIFHNYQEYLHLPEIQDEVFCEVERLNLYENGLKNIQVLPKVFPNCKFAFLNRNKIQNMQPACQWKCLQQLHLSSNSLTKIPDSLQSLTSLTWLNISRNKIQKFPQFTSPLPNIKIVNISNNLLQQMNTIILNFPNLRNLEINFNSLKQIPNQISMLHQLNYFNFSNNCVRQINKEIGKLAKMQVLEISCNNKVDQISERFFEGLKELTVFNCRQNGLKVIPKSIKNCKKLQKFAFNLNQLREWPQIFNEKNNNLISLNASQNISLNIPEVPKNIKILANLQKICLKIMRLTEIPEEIGSLKQLKVIQAQKNMIQKLPLCLTALPELHYLNLSENSIKQIPSQISNLQNLSHFRIILNPLKTIPKQMLLCQNLCVFALSILNLDENSKQNLERFGEYVVEIIQELRNDRWEDSWDLDWEYI